MISPIKTLTLLYGSSPWLTF